MVCLRKLQVSCQWMAGSYLSNSINNTLLLNRAENETIVAELSGSCVWKG